MNSGKNSGIPTSLYEIEAEFEAAVEARLKGLPAFRVYDIEDIGTDRAPVCPYELGEMLEAFDHADSRGGFVVNAAGAVVHVSPKVEPDAVLRIRNDSEGPWHQDYDKVLTWIGRNR